MIKKIYALWLLSLAGFSVLVVSARAVIKHMTSGLNRQWVDKTMQAWASHILNIIKVKYVVVNPFQISPEPREPTIIMCNHSSHFDIPLSIKAFPTASMRMLAKKEIEKIPFMGKAMKVAGFPFIDRKNRLKAIQDLTQVEQLLHEGIVIWIAPEGTRSPNGKLGPFKKGGFITAIHTKAKIIPLGIRGAGNILPARQLSLKLHQTAELHIGKPIDAGQFTLENKEALITCVREAIQTLIDEP